ncbi:MAG: hypothetical protein KC940_07875 [Candidatus Omnitrophica bacterium]|nr:hypothetical protein [Candidatus Omnitrophota bacterium]
MSFAKHLSLLWALLLPASPAVGEILLVSQGEEQEISGSHVYERAVIQGTLILVGDTQLILTGPADDLGRVLFLDEFADIESNLEYAEDGADGTPGANGAGGRDGIVIWNDDRNQVCDYCIDDGIFRVCNVGVEPEDGKPGANALSDAQLGKDGRNGYNLAIIAHGGVDLRGDIDLSAEWGGNGGRGGNGGTGGGGGLGMDACFVGSNGGNGDRGGSGGNGANGGKGGRGGVFRLTGYDDVLLGGSIRANGGRGGAGGNGGFGGGGGRGAHAGGAGRSGGTAGVGGSGGDAGLPGQAGRGAAGGRGGIIEIRAMGDIITSETTGPANKIFEVIGGRGGDGGIAGGGSPGGDAGIGGSVGDPVESHGACGMPGLPSSGENLTGYAGKGGDGGDVFLYANGKVGQESGISGLIEVDAGGGAGGTGGGQFKESTEGVCLWVDWCDHCDGYTPPAGKTGLRGADGGNAGYVIVEASTEIRLLSQIEGGEGGRGGSGAVCGVGWLPNPEILDERNRLPSYGSGGNGGNGGHGGNGGSVRYRAPVIDTDGLYSDNTGVRRRGGAAGKGGTGGGCGDEYGFYGNDGFLGIRGSEGKYEFIGESPENFETALIKDTLLGLEDVGTGVEVELDIDHDGVVEISDFVNSMTLSPPKSEDEP